MTVARNAFEQALRALPTPVRTRVNAGQLLAFGLTDHVIEKESDSRRDLIRAVCEIGASPLYEKAYKRWTESLKSPRYLAWPGRIDGRLHLGLGCADVLETHVTLHRVYGVPYIPGSSLKGAALAYAKRCNDIIDEPLRAFLFGSADTDADQAGAVIFHDAWWIPPGQPGADSRARTPLHAEVVTVHHPKYYGSQGKDPATDFDNPTPNPQVAVRGAFLFAVEGDPDDAALGLELLKRVVTEWGIGGKTGSGYGYFVAGKTSRS